MHLGRLWCYCVHVLYVVLFCTCTVCGVIVYMYCMWCYCVHVLYVVLLCTCTVLANARHTLYIGSLVHWFISTLVH